MKKLKIYMFSILMGIIPVLATMSIVFLQRSASDGTQRFSEIWILGPERTASNYPFNLTVNNSYSCQFFVGVKNNLGYDIDYLLLVKLSNQTDMLPSHLDSLASPLQSVYKFEFSLSNEGIWETYVNLTVPESAFFSIERNVMNLTGILINGESISGFSLMLTRTIETRGYPFLVFFELWAYDVALQDFSYHNRFASLWLNLQPEL